MLDGIHNRAKQHTRSSCHVFQYANFVWNVDCLWRILVSSLEQIESLYYHSICVVLVHTTHVTRNVSSYLYPMCSLSITGYCHRYWSIICQVTALLCTLVHALGIVIHLHYGTMQHGAARPNISTVHRGGAISLCTPVHHCGEPRQCNATPWRVFTATEIKLEIKLCRY